MQTPKLNTTEQLVVNNGKAPHIQLYVRVGLHFCVAWYLACIVPSWISKPEIRALEHLDWCML